MQPGSSSSSSNPLPPPLPPPSVAEDPEYGTLAYAIAGSLQLCAPRVLHNMEQRKAVLSCMIGLLAGTHTRMLEPGMFLAMLRVVERWLVRPYPGQTGSLSSKEGILLCQRLGTLEKLGLFEGTLRKTWETTFLRLIMQLCTSGTLPQVGPLCLGGGGEGGGGLESGGCVCEEDVGDLPTTLLQLIMQLCTSSMLMQVGALCVYDCPHNPHTTLCRCAGMCVCVLCEQELHVP